jgi:hypothetical protein
MVNPDFGDFTLKANSPCVNAGKVVAPYTDGYSGTAPDIGAYEYGKPAWVAGAPSATKLWLGSLIPGQITRRTASASSNANSRIALLAIDGRLDTRWYTIAAQRTGQVYIVNLQNSYTFNRIVMDNIPSPNEYPRYFKVEASTTGSAFTVAGTGTGSSGITSVVFPTQTARYVRIALTADAPVAWSIFEIKIAYDTSMVVETIHRAPSPIGAEITGVSVYSLAGRSMLQADARELAGDGRIPLRPGIYVAKVNFSNGLRLTRTFIQKSGLASARGFCCWIKEITRYPR